MITVTIIIYSAAIFKGVLGNVLKKFVKKRNGRGMYANNVEKRPHDNSQKQNFRFDL